MARLILVTGLPRSGKNTFVKRHLAEAAHIDVDNIRKTLPGYNFPYDAEKEDQIFGAAVLMAASLLRSDCHDHGVVVNDYSMLFSAEGRDSFEDAVRVALTDELGQFPLIVKQSPIHCEPKTCVSRLTSSDQYLLPVILAGAFDSTLQNAPDSETKSICTEMFNVWLKPQLEEMAHSAVQRSINSSEAVPCGS